MDRCSGSQKTEDKYLQGKPERKRKPARPGYRKTQLALDKDKQQNVMNTTMNYWDPCTAPNFFTS